ncbi:hypothetical protein HZY91_00690 [Facklamia sp. DSM 111018]|uniref:Conjugal transfer protein TraX n=2 Tax=Facklamia lactis TaxID=2749967 RepID=A0ABS0LML6_9LACT|nr:hypothetical protein [Facklamia lactis]MBG9985406.1 hypothetical protein [Facklamia lactis]
MTGASLKRIALITMIIDHTAVAIIQNTIFMQSYKYSENFLLIAEQWYNWMRMIGRIAFPLYIYLMIEGYFHTSNLKKYFQRLLILALVSEIPFDLLLNGEIFNWSHQNIFFELIAILFLFYFLDKCRGEWIKILAGTIVIATISYFFQFDYSFYGIIAAFIMFYAYGNRTKEALSIIPAFLFEFYSIFVFLSAVFIFYYNGDRGKINSKLYYWAYPLHLLLLYLIHLWMIQ